VTIARRFRRVCRQCGAPVESEYMEWVREHPQLDSAPSAAALSVMDLDCLVHQYVVKDKSSGRVLARQHLMLVEEKSRLGNVSISQRDTMSVLDQLLWKAHRRRVRALRGSPTMLYHGMHVLRFDGIGPLSSSKILWDDREVSLEQLKEIHLFKLDAISLQPREDRLHHKAHPALAEEWLNKEVV